MEQRRRFFGAEEVWALREAEIDDVAEFKDEETLISKFSGSLTGTSRWGQVRALWPAEWQMEHFFCDIPEREGRKDT